MSLARAASLATQLTRRRGIDEAAVRRGLDIQFERYNLFMENAREVPVEFRLVALEDIEARTPEDLLSINKHLGHLAVDRVHHVQRRIQLVA